MTVLERPPAPARSLNEVRAAIPDACYERPLGRGLALVFRDVLGYGITLTALALADTWWLELPLIVLAALWVAALFVLAHDAAHHALFESRRLNRVVARLAMLPSLHLLDAWDLGHNRLHHGHTVRLGMDFVWHPLTPEQYAALGRFGRLRHRLEWSCLGAGAYYGREVWWNKMVAFRPPAKWAAAFRRDRMFVGAFALVMTALAVAIGLAQGGGAVGAIWMVMKLVVLPFALFIQIIGWTVYVHHVDPALRWYTKADWTPFRAQMESTTVLRFPRLVNLWFHHIFVHVPHHVDPRIPCHQLPAAAAAIEAAFPGTVVDERFRLRRYFAATRACKLYDVGAGTWRRYPTRT